VNDLLAPVAAADPPVVDAAGAGLVDQRFPVDIFRGGTMDEDSWSPMAVEGVPPTGTLVRRSPLLPPKNPGSFQATDEGVDAALAEDATLQVTAAGETMPMGDRPEGVDVKGMLSVAGTLGRTTEEAADAAPLPPRESVRPNMEGSSVTGESGSSSARANENRDWPPTDDLETSVLLLLLLPALVLPPVLARANRGKCGGFDGDKPEDVIPKDCENAPWNGDMIFELSKPIEVLLPCLGGEA